MVENKISQRLNQFLDSDKLPWILICVGIALRLVQYLHNPSLWFDDSVMALDIINRSFSEFMHPSPDYPQSHPFGFMILIKLAINSFGTGEYALRLFPLLFSILSLFFFYSVAKSYIKPGAVPVALALFAILYPVIWFSSNIKPYSGDIAFTLLIFTIAGHIRSKSLNVLRIALFAVIGAMIIWLSYPSVFVLSGAGICLAVYSLKRKEWTKIGGLCIVYSIWALSFIAFYFIYINKLIADTAANIGMERLMKMEQAFMPFPPKSLADIKWFIDLFFETFHDPVGLTLSGIAALAFIIGCISLFSEKKETFFILVSPIIITLVAAAFHKYPFKGRLILFLVPLILLFIAEGIEYIRDKTRNKSVILAITVIALLFIHPLTIAAYRAVKPSSRGEIKPVLSYIKDNWNEEDILYVHYYAQYAFEYYTKHYPKPYVFNTDEYITGIAPRGWYTRWRKQDVAKYYDPDKVITQSNSDILKTYIRDLNNLKGRKRVWVLFTEVIPRNGMREENIFLHHLDSIGRKIDSFGKPGVSAVYLYDLSGDISIEIR